jgi:hypothetical protein
MKLNLDNIIRTVLSEQKTPTATVIIKSTYGTLQQQRVQETIGAVNGFRVKVKVKSKTPVSEEKVLSIISDKLKDHPDIKPYTGGNYIIVRSDDQKLSDNTYLYNYLVFDRKLVEDILDKFKPEGFSGKFADVAFLENTSNRIGDSKVYNLSDIAGVYVKHYKERVDELKWKQYKKWYDTVKNVNKRISTVSVPDFEELPRGETSFSTVEDAPWAVVVDGKVYELTKTGKFNVYGSGPGVLKDLQGNVVFSGEFKPGKDDESQPWNGIVTKSAAFASKMDPNLYGMLFTGELKNGYYVKGELDLGDGYIFKNGEFEKGRRKQGKAYKNDELIGYYQNFEYIDLTINVSSKSDNTQIKALKEDLIKMYQNNLDYVNNLPENLKNVIINFTSKPANGNWDSTMKAIVSITNIGLMGQDAIDPNTKKPYPGIDLTVLAKIRQLIIKYQTEKIK